MGAPQLTIQGLLAAAWERLADAGLEGGGFEAQLLLAHALAQKRGWLVANPRHRPDVHERTFFEALVARRAHREPYGYVVGSQEWLDFALLVDRNVLIPRPETEILALAALAELRSRAAQAADALVLPGLDRGRSGIGQSPTGSSNGAAIASDGGQDLEHATRTSLTMRPGGAPALPVAVDVGTGSGAMAIAMARGMPRATIYATDSSQGALRVARRNASLQGALGIAFLHCDLLAALPVPVDLLVANLPYIPTAELVNLEPELSYEPLFALDGGADGLAAIAALLQQAPRHLAPGATLLLECGHDQAPRVIDIASQVWPDLSASTFPDLAGIARFVRLDLPRQ